MSQPHAQPPDPAAGPLPDWPLSRALLEAILADRISDRAVCALIWHRLGYEPRGSNQPWPAGAATPADWAASDPTAPQLISERAASVRLTRSIPRPHKQLLKEELGFAGYRIGELYPRRTRRATAVNWLLSWLRREDAALPEAGPLPALLPPPESPVHGHPGDPPIG
jgi:hypothetical protein